MNRPRKDLHDHNGRMVDGVSPHPRGGFYIINREGQRQYFGKGPDAPGRTRQRHLDLAIPGSHRPRRTLTHEVDRTVFAEQVLETHPQIRQRVVRQPGS